MSNRLDLIIWYLEDDPEDFHRVKTLEHDIATINYWDHRANQLKDQEPTP